MFTLTIKTDNAAFHEGDLVNEIRNILEQASEKLAMNGVDISPVKLRDSNGNTVGSYTVKE